MQKTQKYDHQRVELKWQKEWYKAKLFSPDVEKAKKPFYNLWMYPYPSAEGLHAGHAFASTGSDVYGRFMRMHGKHVFQPIGYDSFGLHSENFALKTKEHPKNLIARTVKYYEKQLKSIGHGFDWTKTVTASDIDYYRWTQWLFVQLFKAGLAYRKKSFVNWCPSCKTVLADEQVIAGLCERCETKVEQKEFEQWFFRITDYADRLLKNLSKIDWPARVKVAQRNWIGRSEGALIKFPVFNSELSIETFTTRPDTLHGATFFVLAPEHPVVAMLLSSKFKIQGSKLKEVKEYIKRSQRMSKQDRIGDRKKTGVFTGLYVVNPANGEKIPVYMADYVVMDYGEGAIMGVPAHDQRDWDFAKAYKLPIIEVISGGKVEEEAYDGPGKLVNSDKWNGWQVPDEVDKVIKDLAKQGKGKAATSYHLRDWLISRQRYWGPPIPMIFCEECAKKGKSWFNSGKAEKWINQFESKSKFRKKIIKNWELGIGHSSDWSAAGWYPVDEKELPVELPYYQDYKPKGKGSGPLADHPEFYQVACPECGAPARRETDVSDTFLDSSWYFLRYPSVGAKNSSLEIGNLKLEIPWNRQITRKWLPVDLYFGGAEHSVLHLMYARFVTMVLYDLGFIDFEEPFPWFFAHGLMIKDGAKMSKSRGNVVNPDEYIEKFGADTLRLYLMFMGPMDGYPDFRDTGIEGMRRFVEKIWGLFQTDPTSLKIRGVDQKELLIKMHQTIKKVTEDIEKFHYNTAISAIMEYVNLLRDKVISNEIPQQVRSTQIEKSERDDKVGSKSLPTLSNSSQWREALKVLAQLLTPFAPHLAEEVWVNLLGRRFSIQTSAWPKYNPELARERKITIVVQVDGKLRATLKIQSTKSKIQKEVIKLAKSDEKIKKWLSGKKLKDTVFVPGKLVNFVTK